MAKDLPCPDKTGFEEETPRLNTMLKSKSDFIQFLNNCSERALFEKYVPMGLPGLCINGRWSGSTTKIQKWWDDIHGQPISKTLQNPSK